MTGSACQSTRREGSVSGRWPATTSGRYRADDQKLFGLRDVRWTIEPGAYVEFWPIPDTLRAHFELRHGVDSRDGFVADAAVDYLWHVGPATVAIGPRLSLGDEDFLRRDYGVSFTDAVQNGIVTPFKPVGGLHSAGVATSLTYDVTQAWSTTVYGGYDRLVGDAAKSPLIRKLGSADQFKAGLTVSYSFGFSGFGLLPTSAQGGARAKRRDFPVPQVLRRGPVNALA